jgi:hypothetical protein
VEFGLVAVPAASVPTPVGVPFDASDEHAGKAIAKASKGNDTRRPDLIVYIAQIFLSVLNDPS